MDSNALLIVLSAVVGLVGTYLRYYTHAQIGDAVELITRRNAAELHELRQEIRELSDMVIRLDQAAQDDRSTHR